jgi:hypothetical protein
MKKIIRAIKQGGSVVLTMSDFLNLGKSYLVKEVFDNDKKYILISEINPEPIIHEQIPASILNGAV